MSAALLPMPMWQLFDGQATLPGAKVYSYQPGTTTPKALYADASGTTPLANPAIADADGRLQVWGIGAYKLVVHDAADALVWSMDQVSSAGGGSGGLALSTYPTFAAALTAAQAQGRGILVDTAMGIPTNTTVPRAVPLMCTPPGVLTVASGVTLTLNSPLVAGRWQIVSANGASTGLVRFGVGACAEVFPEWWGIDPTGVTANNALWAQVIAAATTTVNVPISLLGPYALDGATDPALVLVSGTELVGTHREGAFAVATAQTGVFRYTGTGTAIGNANISNTQYNTRLENLVVYDVSDTGAFGIHLFDPGTLEMRNVTVEGFATGYKAEGDSYYGRITQLKCREYRTYGCVFTHDLNTMDVDVQLNSHHTAITAGLAIGSQAAGDYGGHLHPRVVASIEQASGTPVTLNYLLGGTYALYIENTGLAANYGAAALRLAYARGVQLHLFINAQGVQNYAVQVFTGGDATFQAALAQVRVTGEVRGAAVADVQIYQNGEGTWGIDLSGLAFATGLGTQGWEVGRTLGTTYLTQGGRKPIVNEGRGSTAWSTQWQVGDRVENLSAGAPGEVVGWQCITAGNPGTWVAYGAFAGVVATPSDASIDPNYAPQHFANVGATGAVTINLPSTAQAVQARYRFTRTASFAVHINPDNVTAIRGGGVGKYLSLESDGASVELALVGSVWELLTIRGTTSFEA